MAPQKGTPKLYVLDCCYSPSEWAPSSPEFPPDAPAPHDCAVLRSTSPGYYGYSDSSSGVTVYLAEALEDIAPGNGVDWGELRALIAAPMESFVGGKVEPQQTTLPKHFVFAKQGTWKEAQARIRMLEKRVKELEASAGCGPGGAAKCLSAAQVEMIAESLKIASRHFTYLAVMNQAGITVEDRDKLREKIQTGQAALTCVKDLGFYLSN